MTTPTNQQLVKIINTKLKHSGWVISKTIKKQPTGYIGYSFVLYEKKDDVTIVVELQAKTPGALAKKIINYFKV